MIEPCGEHEIAILGGLLINRFGSTYVSGEVLIFDIKTNDMKIVIANNERQSD